LLCLVILCNGCMTGDAGWFYNPLRTKGLNPKFQRPWQGPFLGYRKNQ
jgi:hypothetical protein